MPYRPVSITMTISKDNQLIMELIYLYFQRFNYGCIVIC